MTQASFQAVCQVSSCLTRQNLQGHLHTGCLFLEHLSGVQEVLQSWDEPEYVCNTGLFHSVYGTELFQVVPVISDRLAFFVTMTILAISCLHLLVRLLCTALLNGLCALLEQLIFVCITWNTCILAE